MALIKVSVKSRQIPQIKVNSKDALPILATRQGYYFNGYKLELYETVAPA
jgi:hypothetical protein